jgi:hypothetical protein
LSERPVAPAGRQDGDRGWAPATDPLVRGVFALLVLACLGAFFVTQRLKHTPTPVQRFKRTPRFSPYPSGHNKLEQISFKLDRADSVTVTVIDTSGNSVATLVEGYPVPRYKQFSLRWNGRRGAAHGHSLERTSAGHAFLVPHNRGSLAPPGEYRVRVALQNHDRTLESPWTFTLVGP